MKLGELAARLGCKLQGDENVEVHGVAGIENAQAGEVTFLSNPKYSRELAKTLASAVFVDEKAVIERGPACRLSLPFARRTRTLISRARLICFPPRRPILREFIRPPSWRNPRRSARGRTSARTVLWMKAWKLAEARCCIAW